MSTGNGTEPRILSLHAPALSAHDREQQRLAYIAAVDEMARTLRVTVQILNETTKQVDGLLAQCDTLYRQQVDAMLRIDSLERAAAVANTVLIRERRLAVMWQWIAIACGVAVLILMAISPR